MSEIKFSRQAFVENAKKEALSRLDWLETKGKGLNPGAKLVQKQTLSNVITLCKLFDEYAQEGKEEKVFLFMDFMNQLSNSGIIGNVRFTLESVEYDILKAKKLVHRKVFIPNTLRDFMRFCTWVCIDIVGA
jgi:hypothetical protein